MRTPEAQGVAGSGKLTLLPHHPGADRRSLQHLAAECEQFSPVVALEDIDEPEALLLDVTGLAPLWGDGGEKGLAQAISRWSLAQQLDAAIAIAPTVGLALATARFVSHALGPSVVRSRQAFRLAAKLPVEALRVKASVVEGLKSLGIETIGSLLELPRASLPSRFGQELVCRLDELLGDAPEPVESFRREPPLADKWEFESAVRCAQTLERVRLELLGRLTDRLKQRRYGVLRLLIDHHLDSISVPPVRVTLRLFRPTASAKELAELATLHLDGVRFPFAVRAIQVLVGATAPNDPQQRTLFDTDQQGDPHALALLINRLACRVGVERVLRVQKQQSFDPQRAYATAPATDVTPEAFALTPLQAQKARQLPMTMYAVSKLVAVETDEYGQPILLSWHGKQAVVRHWGPERLETGWWRGRSVRRDAWWVELENGSRLWLHCDLRGRQWRLAGEF